MFTVFFYISSILFVLWNVQTVAFCILTYCEHIFFRQIYFSENWRKEVNFKKFIKLLILFGPATIIYVVMSPIFRRTYNYMNMKTIELSIKTRSKIRKWFDLE